jgi:hypothetical protein
LTARLAGGSVTGRHAYTAINSHRQRFWRWVHMGINPFTKQEQMFKAKPARKVIKVRPLKALREMAK